MAGQTGKGPKFCPVPGLLALDSMEIFGEKSGPKFNSKPWQADNNNKNKKPEAPPSARLPSREAIIASIYVKDYHNISASSAPGRKLKSAFIWAGDALLTGKIYGKQGLFLNKRMEKTKDVV